MSVALATSPPLRLLATIVVGLWALSSGVQAQEAGSAPTATDHLLVVTRTVQPRIAYRGVPLEDNAVRVQATTFPGRVFHQTVDAAMERVVGDSDLHRFGSAGIGSIAAMQGVLSGGLRRSGAPDLLGGTGSTITTAPLGAGARAGGAVAATTAGLGGLINTSLLPALGTNAGGGQ